MKKIALVNEYELPIEVKKEDRYYVAKCSVWSDCYAQGYSLDDAISNITGVAKELIAIYEQEDKKVPLKLKRQNRSETSFKFDLSILAPAI